METNANELIAYSARENTVAADGPGENSPFAMALAKHLAEPGLCSGGCAMPTADGTKGCSGRLNILSPLRGSVSQPMKEFAP